jgi:hypothetical protein
MSIEMKMRYKIVFVRCAPNTLKPTIEHTNVRRLLSSFWTVDYEYQANVRQARKMIVGGKYQANVGFSVENDTRLTAQAIA